MSDDINIDNIKKALLQKTKKKKVRSSDYLSTGSTLLDLACSGKIEGGLIKGGYFFLVGDSSSGKTFTSLTCLAEAAKSESFKNHRFIYDNSENGALMDMATFFGQKVADKMEPPAKDKKDKPVYSSTIEEFTIISKVADVACTRNGEVIYPCTIMLVFAEVRTVP